MTMILRLFIVMALLSVGQSARASSYGYPEDKQPQVSLKQACEIAESILKKNGIGEGYFVCSAGLSGDEDQNGAGAWILRYRNTQGDNIQIGIYFPEDQCFVQATTKDGGYSVKMYTRNGEISKKWLEDEERTKRKWKESDGFFESLERKNDETGRPAARPESKSESGNKPKPESEAQIR